MLEIRNKHICSATPDIPRCGIVGKHCLPRVERGDYSNRNYGYLRSRGTLRLMTREERRCELTGASASRRLGLQPAADNNKQTGKCPLLAYGQ
jgi:hypothetical protein